MLDKLAIAVIANETGKGGLNNILGGFGVGLRNGLIQEGANADFAVELLDRVDVLPPLFIAFNVTGSNMYESLLQSGVTLIVWSVDSIFFKNYLMFKNLAAAPNFYALSVTPSDKKPVELFLPDLKYFSVFVGTDPEVWKYDENVDKEHDLVFMSYLTDYEAEIERLRQTSSPAVFKLFQDIYDYLLNNPDKSVWEAFKLAMGNYGVNIYKEDADFYADFLIKVSYIVTHAQRVKLVKNLEKIGVKVWGGEMWEKYISGRNQYMGAAEMKEAVKIFQRSRVVLHQHPVQVANCVHERVINALSTGTFVASSDIPVIKQEFGDNLLYFKTEQDSSLCDDINFYLKNDDIRQEKALKAREIVLDRHTWKHRAREILDLIKCE